MDGCGVGASASEVLCTGGGVCNSPVGAEHG